MLAAIVVLLAVFGASTQCVADCLTQQTVPPCHQQSKGKDSGSEPCKQVQPAADTQAICTPVAEAPAPIPVAFELFTSEVAPADHAPDPFSVLRL